MSGFSPATTAFQQGLAAHNNREWFLAHKAEYEAVVKAPLAALVETLALAFAAHDIPLTGSGKTSIFRINRDVRFAHDKSPYKTNAGAILSRDGTRKARGILYVHITPVDGLMAMGFYSPEPADLATMRHAMVAQPKVWAALEAGLAGAGHPLSREEAMTRLPKGFDAAPVVLAEALKLRHLIIRHPLTLAEMYDPALVERVLAFARIGLPLLEWGWRALHGARAPHRG
jgi:uncharacterized protein (TIGR02453 family)